MPNMMLQESNCFLEPQEELNDKQRNVEGYKSDIITQRRQREFIPEEKKDDGYWDKRRRNNKAAKRSREKRKVNDTFLESKVLELSKENHILRNQLNTVFEKYGIKSENISLMEEKKITLPCDDEYFNLNSIKQEGDIETSKDAFYALSIPVTNDKDTCIYKNNPTVDMSYDNDNSSNCTTIRKHSVYPNIYKSHCQDIQSEYRDMLYRQNLQDNGSNELALNLSTRCYNVVHTRSESSERRETSHVYSNSSLFDSTSSGDESLYSRSSSIGTSDKLSTSYRYPEHTRPDSSERREKRRVSSNSSPFDRNSSGDESWYSRSSNSETNQMEEASMLPQIIRYTTKENEVETNHISLNQIIKQEQEDPITQGIDAPIDRLLNYISSNQDIIIEEPILKRQKIGVITNGSRSLGFGEQLAILSSNVDMLKKILMRRSQ